MTFLFLGYSIIIIMLFFFFIVNPLILVTKADFTVLYLNICPTGPKVISADEHPLHPIERVFDEKTTELQSAKISAQRGAKCLVGASSKCSG